VKPLEFSRDDGSPGDRAPCPGLSVQAAKGPI